jgi:hypothetical protein
MKNKGDFTLRIALSLGAAMVLLASPAVSSTSGNDQPTPRLGGNEIICKSALGSGVASRMGKRRICMTKIEWQMQTEDNRDQTEDLQRRSLATPPKT